MKICRCLSSCLFALGFLAVPLSPAQEAATSVAPSPAPAPTPASSSAPSAPAAALVNEAGNAASQSTQADTPQKPQQEKPPPQQQHAEAERIALLESRVATLERELQQLRAAMRSAGAALTGAAGGGDTLADRSANANARRSPNPVSRPGASTHFVVPPPTDEERKKVSALSAEGRTRYMNEIRTRSDELSKATPEERAIIFREVLEQVVQTEAANAGRATGSPTPNANGNANTAAPIPPPAADAAQGERGGFTSLPPAARARFVEELRERQNEFANASPEDRQAMVKEVMERAKRAAASETSSDSGSNNIASPTMPVPTPTPAPAPAPAPALDGVGRPPLPSLPPPMPPMVNRDANALPEGPTAAPAPSTVTSADASRQRFQALSEAQRRRFLDEMRRKRESLTNATPAEREAIMHEALTKVEKEAGKDAATPGVNAATPPPPPQQQEPQQQSKTMPADGKKK